MSSMIFFLLVMSYQTFLDLNIWHSTNDKRFLEQADTMVNDSCIEYQSLANTGFSFLDSLLTLEDKYFQRNRNHTLDSIFIYANSRWSKVDSMLEDVQKLENGYRLMFLSTLPDGF